MNHGINLDNIVSWTSYKPRALSNGHEFEESNQLDLIEKSLETAKTKSSEIDNPTGSSASSVQGAGALYETINVSQDETARVGFQWMRPHPAIFLQAQNSSETSKIAVQASELVNVYARKRGRKRARNDNGENAKISSNTVLPTSDFDSEDERGNGLFCLPSCKIDLTQLLDPPLLSEWLPGQDISTTYGIDDCEHDVKRDENSDPDRNTLDLKRDITIIVSSAMHKSESSSRRLNVDGLKTRALMELSASDWLQMLPSHELLEQMKTRPSGDSKPLPVISEIFSWLVSACPSLALGRHILTILIPVLFHSVCLDSLTSNEIENVKEIAMLLVQRCGLGKLSKKDLHNLTKSLPRNDAGIELQMSIAKEYYEFNK